MGDEYSEEAGWGPKKAKIGFGVAEKKEEAKNEGEFMLNEAKNNMREKLGPFSCIGNPEDDDDTRKNPLKRTRRKSLEEQTKNQEGQIGQITFVDSSNKGKKMRSSQSFNRDERAFFIN